MCRLPRPFSRETWREQTLAKGTQHLTITAEDSRHADWLDFFYRRAHGKRITLQTFSDVAGYLWSFPRADHTSVGLGCRLGALPLQEMGGRLDRFLAEMCPGASVGRRWAALLPFAADATLWDTSCAGPGWALLGDAAGHVHPLTGEGIAYALWSAELLAQAFADGDPLGYEALWRAAYGHELAATSEVLRQSIAAKVGAYEILFHLGLMGTIRECGA